VRIALLIILAGLSYALALWALMAATQHLQPGVKSKDAAGTPLDGDQDRLVSLYTPRGLQLRQLAKLLLMVCVISTIILIVEVASLLPTLWQAKLPADPGPAFGVVQNKPNIALIWAAALVLAVIGFVVTRSHPFFAAGILALVIIWSHQLIGGFPPRSRVFESAAEHSYAMQVCTAFLIALLATGQGMRLWMVRARKRAQETLAVPEPSSSS
jgi:hypothetical protein